MCQRDLRHLPETLPPVGDLFGLLLPPEGESMRLSVILPAKNEAEGLRQTLPRLREAQPDAEMIVVNGGSTDDTASVAAAHGARVLSSPSWMGNGAAIKRVARAASGKIPGFTDPDGQHDPVELEGLLDRREPSSDMIAIGREPGREKGCQ